MAGLADERSGLWARRDLVAVGVVALITFGLAVRFEGLERFVEWSRSYEHLEIDEFVTLLAILPIALSVFIARRWRDLSREVVARRRVQEELAQEALHDGLTGLANRTLLNERLQQALLASRRSGTAVAVTFLDLDRFKEINDTLGHHVGDELLKQIGPRLSGELREVDTIARLGGDEFAVLLPDVADSISAVAVARRLQSALERAFSVNDLAVVVEGSIGVAVFPEHGQDAETLMQRADFAMYRAKEMHLGVSVYDPELERDTPKRLSLLTDLRRALDEQELVLFFQPKADLVTGQVRGVEALVRWQHPQHGLVGPDEFIPAAEQTGMIKQLALYVLDGAMQQCREWHDAGLDLTIAVNLSARNLLDLELPDHVARLLDKWQLSPGSLVLEITETTVMVDPGRALRVLERLSQMGIALAIDDYGTGYSSLAYLRRLPVTQLKIDKSFVTTMTSEDDNAVIVRSTVDLARHLGLDVVAEGVEDRETLQRLTDLGCDAAQGYYLSHPVPGNQIPAALRRLQALASSSAS